MTAPASGAARRSANPAPTLPDEFQCKASFRVRKTTLIIVMHDSPPHRQNTSIQLRKKLNKRTLPITSPDDDLKNSPGLDAPSPALIRLFSTCPSHTSLLSTTFQPPSFGPSSHSTLSSDVANGQIFVYPLPSTPPTTHPRCSSTTHWTLLHIRGLVRMCIDFGYPMLPPSSSKRVSVSVSVWVGLGFVGDSALEFVPPLAPSSPSTLLHPATRTHQSLRTAPRLIAPLSLLPTSPQRLHPTIHAPLSLPPLYVWRKNSVLRFREHGLGGGLGRVGRPV